MAVGSMVGCSWCLDFNYLETKNKKLDVAKAREVRGITSLERDSMRYTEAMSKAEPTVADDRVARLLDQLGPLR